jgi:hypothetical protein
MKDQFENGGGIILIGYKRNKVDGTGLATYG